MGVPAIYLSVLLHKVVQDAQFCKNIVQDSVDYSVLLEASARMGQNVFGILVSLRQPVRTLSVIMLRSQQVVRPIVMLILVVVLMSHNIVRKDIVKTTPLELMLCVENKIHHVQVME